MWKNDHRKARMEVMRTGYYEIIQRRGDNGLGLGNSCEAGDKRVRLQTYV